MKMQNSNWVHPKVAKEAGISREIPIHVLIETHGALQDVEKLLHYHGYKF